MKRIAAARRHQRKQMMKQRNRELIVLADGRVPIVCPFERLMLLDLLVRQGDLTVTKDADGVPRYVMTEEFSDWMDEI